MLAFGFISSRSAVLQFLGVGGIFNSHKGKFRASIVRDLELLQNPLTDLQRRQGVGWPDLKLQRIPSPDVRVDRRWNKSEREKESPLQIDLAGEEGLTSVCRSVAIHAHLRRRRGSGLSLKIEEVQGEQEGTQ
ncbi:hypothetical protein MRB53_022176 [Persea americana]|uniref:Uncharacterized protein n=1 Tax=Persea americana TaxID=3435 RepID=A0ACC2L6F1_PERAE|nr:hypothetical protein MRB53_022176 [Persea americana]